MGDGRWNFTMKVYNEQSDKKISNKLKEILENMRKIRNFDAEDYIEAKADLLNRYMKKSNLKACVIAISGGIDSAVVLGIVKKASEKENSPIEKNCSNATSYIKIYWCNKSRRCNFKRKRIM